MKMLRKLRKEKGISMKELGAQVGVAESTISQYETGKRQPDFNMLLKLSSYFDVSVDYLLKGDTVKTERPVVSVTDEDIKFALFHGDETISDEAYEEVKAFAEFVKQKYQKGKR